MKTKLHKGLFREDITSVANQQPMSSAKLLKMKLEKISKFLLIFAVISGWIFAGWPQIFNFPPKVQETNAAAIAQYSGGLLVYADTTTVGTPKYKTFDDTTGFGAEQSASSVGAVAIEWIRVAASPTKDEWIIATRDAGDVIKAQVCTGVDGGISCGAPTQITATAGTHGFRNFDVAYEQSSGDALLVYGTATVDELRRIVWTSGSWGSDAATTTTKTAGAIEWVELTSRPASDQIGIAYSDTADDIMAHRWNGSEVDNPATQAITTSGVAGDVRKFDISFEGTSGDMVVGAPVSAAGTIAYGQLSGTTWSFVSGTGVDVVTAFLDMQEPGSDDDIAVEAVGSAASSNLTEGSEWNGTGVTDGNNGDDVAANWAASYQLGAVAYLSTTYYGVSVFSSTLSGTDDIEWWTMSSAGTITDQTVNTRTRGASTFIDLFDYPNANKVLLITADANSDLWADTWDGAGVTGTAWTDLTSGGTLENSLGSAITDVVDFAFRLAPNAPTVTTSAATSPTATTAVLNGNITATGGANATVRGFAYGTNSLLSGGDTATTSNDTGSFGVAAFNANPSPLTGLTCNTTYYSRAYATNPGGTGLGSISASFITSACNSAPSAPSQDSPANSATGVSITPTFLMTTTDADSDKLGYKVTIYSESGCTTVVQTNDQAVSSTGWTGSNATCTANPTACYTSGTQGSYLTQSALSNNTQYWWKASAKDPDGTGNFTNSATCNTFTTVAANSAPTLSNNRLDRTTLTLNENTFVWASSSVLVTDTNGCSDISSVSAKLYLASTANSGTLCSYDGNNCYTASSCMATTTGNQCAADNDVEYDCGFQVWYTAEATDASAPTYASSIWSVSATSTDAASATGTATNTAQTVEVGTLNALSLSGNIAYPETNPNNNTGATNQTITVTNTGNTAIDAEISGDVMCVIYPSCSTGFFGPSQQRFGASNVTYASLANLLSATATPATIQINLAKPTSTTTPITVDLFWGIAIPVGKAVGTYTGQNIFTAVANI